MKASRGSPVCRRSGSTRFAADAVPLSLSFSRPMRSTSVTPGRRGGGAPPLPPARRPFPPLFSAPAAPPWGAPPPPFVGAGGGGGAPPAVRGALLPPPADLALRARDVVERLIGRLDPE